MIRPGLTVLSILAINAAHASTVVGSHTSIDPTMKSPLLVQTLDSGQTWSAKEIIGLDESVSAFLRTSTCSDSICIAGGNTVDLQGLLVQSLDHGNTWATVDVEDLGYRPLMGSSCENDHCILIGNGDSNQSVIVQTFDAGETWKVFEPRTMQDNIKYILSDVKCKNDYCIVVGAKWIQEEIDVTPMWLESFDKGRTWKMTVQKIPGIFSHVDCSDTRCVAIGQDVIKFPMPMLYEISTTASFRPKRTQLEELFGIFTSVSCNQLTCVVTGETVRALLDTAPLQVFIAESQEVGDWEHQMIDNADKKGKPVLLDVDCSDSYCLAVGNIQRNNNVEGVVLSNRNGSWENETLPFEGSTAMMLHTTHCDNTHCYVAGKQNDGTALLMQKMQRGNWAIINPVGMFDTAHFYSRPTAVRAFVE